MRRVSIGVALVALLMFTSVASANALSYLQPYQLNGWQDRDFEGVLFTTRDGQGNITGLLPHTTQGVIPTLASGDITLGMWEVTGLNSLEYWAPPAGLPQTYATPGAETFTATFALVVDTVTPINGGPDLAVTYRPLTGLEWTSLFTNGYIPLGMIPTTPGSIGTVWSDNTLSGGGFINNNVAGGAGNFNPSDWDLDFATALGTGLWEIGFNGSPNEYWSATINFNGAAVPQATSVDYEANLSVTAYLSGPSLLLHNFYDRDGDLNFADIFDPVAQVMLQGEINQNLMSADALFQTNTQIWIYPTPEPGTLALLGLGLAAMGGVVYRRRRQK